VIVFGPGDHGEPTAGDWAAWCDTIGYEIVTRIGTRVPRRYLNASRETA
jgi:alanine racemase